GPTAARSRVSTSLTVYGVACRVPPRAASPRSAGRIIGDYRRRRGRRGSGGRSGRAPGRARTRGPAPTPACTLRRDRTRGHPVSGPGPEAPGRGRLREAPAALRPLRALPGTRVGLGLLRSRVGSGRAGTRAGSRGSPAGRTLRTLKRAGRPPAGDLGAAGEAGSAGGPWRQGHPHPGTTGRAVVRGPRRCPAGA